MKILKEIATVIGLINKLPKSKAKRIQGEKQNKIDQLFKTKRL